jgi:hypothetical protein
MAQSQRPVQAVIQTAAILTNDPIHLDGVDIKPAGNFDPAKAVNSFVITAQDPVKLAQYKKVLQEVSQQNIQKLQATADVLNQKLKQQQQKAAAAARQAQLLANAQVSQQSALSSAAHVHQQDPSAATTVLLAQQRAALQSTKVKVDQARAQASAAAAAAQDTQRKLDKLRTKLDGADQMNSPSDSIPSPASQAPSPAPQVASTLVAPAARIQQPPSTAPVAPSQALIAPAAQLQKTTTDMDLLTINASGKAVSDSINRAKSQMQNGQVSQAAQTLQVAQQTQQVMSGAAQRILDNPNASQSARDTAAKVKVQAAQNAQAISDATATLDRLGNNDPTVNQKELDNAAQAMGYAAHHAASMATDAAPLVDSQPDAPSDIQVQTRQKQLQTAALASNLHVVNKMVSNQAQATGQPQVRAVSQNVNANDTVGQAIGLINKHLVPNKVASQAVASAALDAAQNVVNTVNTHAVPQIPSDIMGPASTPADSLSLAPVDSSAPSDTSSMSFAYRDPSSSDSMTSPSPSDSAAPAVNAARQADAAAQHATLASKQAAGIAQIQPAAAQHARDAQVQASQAQQQAKRALQAAQLARTQAAAGQVPTVAVATATDAATQSRQSQQQAAAALARAKAAQSSQSSSPSSQSSSQSLQQNLARLRQGQGSLNYSKPPSISTSSTPSQ